MSSMPAPRKRGRPRKAESVAASLPTSIRETREPAAPLFTKEELVAGLKSKRFRKVVFMVGAGISVAAGIPDFRSPKSGLYAQVKSMGLPCPEDIFSLDYLIEDPKPFFALAKRLLYSVQPVNAHLFMKACCDRKQLFMVYTQNIDGLELAAGVPMKKLLQAHGHMRSAHCIKCKQAFSIEEFIPFAQREEVMRCPKCSSIVKPDIIFFGEKVPRKFDSLLGKVSEADLIIVMGTSLQVRPFSELLKQVSPSVPIAIINRDMPKVMLARSQSQHTLFLQGDIEAVVTQLAQDMGWTLPSAPAVSSSTMYSSSSSSSSAAAAATTVTASVVVATASVAGETVLATGDYSAKRQCTAKR